MIPGVDNPQSWNRYSYVVNNPLRFTDPTGHYCAEEDENGRMVRADCKTGEILKPKPKSKGTGSGGGNNCNGPNPSIVCLPKDPKEELPLLPILSSNVPSSDSASPTIPDLQGFDDWAWFTDKALNFIDYMSSAEDIMNAGTPVYRQVKYAFGTGGLEAVIDSVQYGLKDRWSTSLTPEQRVGRMVAVGGQSFLIDRASDRLGVVGIPFGGKAGEIAVQYIVSAALSEFVAPRTTYWLFDTFNLGVPIDVSPIK